MTSFKMGEEIVWAGTDGTPESIRSGVVTRVGKDNGQPLVWVDNQHKLEDCIYAAFCLPARVRAEYVEILTERERLKKAYNDSASLIYQLKNAIARGEK